MLLAGILTALSFPHMILAQPVRSVTDFSSDIPLPYLGNGMIGFRIKPVPFTSWKAAVSGYVKDHEEGGWETLAYGPYPFGMDYRLDDGPWMSEQADDVRVHSQSLDMGCGELTTMLSFPLGSGRAEATVLQFLSRTTPVVGVQEVRLKIPQDGRLLVRAQINFGPGNDLLAGLPPHHDRVADLIVLSTSTGERSRCGVAVRNDLSAPDARREPLAGEDPQTARVFTVDVRAGEELVIRTLAATMSSLYHPEPHLEACRLVNWAHELGFEKLRQRNRQAWETIWRSRIRIEGDRRAQAYLDWCLFYTFSSVHPSSLTSMAPFGLSQVANYFGHVFWDTDTYTTPALILLSPETARMTVDFRRRNLEAARKRAAVYGFAGAMYPWESATTGEEATPSTVDTGWLEQHVNMCVAIAAWQYQLAAGDRDQAEHRTWPIVRSVADWVVSRVVETPRGFEIHDMMSAQEGMTVQNSCYVNAIAAEALRIAGKCARLLDRPADPRWERIAGRMFIPTGPAPPESGIDGEIIYMHDAGWIEEGASVDLFMLGFPFDLPFDRPLLERTYAFYAGKYQRVLSMGVVFKIGQAAFIGDRHRQRALFERVISEKCDPVWGMGREYTGDRQTCFVTTQAGMLQTVLMAMTGLRFERDNWAKYPACLPEGWESITVDRMHLGGRVYRMRAVDGEPAELIPAGSP
jgi:trehalose/maltose hydrolase-like predicted phosphorylase